VKLLPRSTYWLLAVLALACIIVTATQAALQPAAAVADADPGILPVVVSGEQLASFQGLPVDQIYVYAFGGSGWEQIPFQIDEKAAADEGQRVYSAEGDGTLDPDEELVFMVSDMGTKAPAAAWVPGAAEDQRVEVEVAVDGETGWAYVFSGPNLTRTFSEDYIRFSGPAQRIIAERYEVGFLDNGYGVDELRLNASGIDILDRSKLRLHILAQIVIPIRRTCTEDNITQPFLSGGCGLESRPVSPLKDGPVRLVWGADGGFAYGSIFQLEDEVDLSGLSLPGASVSVERFRFSFDFDPQAVATGTPTLYLDANLDQPVRVDGEPDEVPTEPLAAWRQVSHPTGTLVLTTDLTASDLDVTNYYVDDATVDSDDTGDQRSYGDSGFAADNPAGSFSLTTSLVVLPPTTDAVGDAYAALLDQPLVPLVTRQFAPEATQGLIYLPLVRR
jgi:hypothetical protein